MAHRTLIPLLYLRVNLVRGTSNSDSHDAIQMNLDDMYSTSSAKLVRDISSFEGNLICIF